MNYWGMNINTWEEFYPRDGVTSPSYKNEWERYNRKEVADFLNWQCDLVNEYKRKDQFVTHCFMPDFHNIDQVESFRQMQCVFSLQQPSHIQLPPPLLVMGKAQVQGPFPDTKLHILVAHIRVLFQQQGYCA